MRTLRLDRGRSVGTRAATGDRNRLVARFRRLRANLRTHRSVDTLLDRIEQLLHGTSGWIAACRKLVWRSLVRFRHPDASVDHRFVEHEEHRCHERGHTLGSQHLDIKKRRWLTLVPEHFFRFSRPPRLTLAGLDACWSD